jgi:ABC-type multidrug transport system ATPase subunit
MTPPVLKAQNLAKRYVAITAVRQIAFAIRAGEILGAMGPNRAGKSTNVKW